MGFNAFLASIETPALRAIANDRRILVHGPYLEGPIELLTEKESWCPLRAS
jgi:hypothetical protein